MASENDFQELRFSGDRMKLDGLGLFESQDMENASSLHEETDQERLLQPEHKYNVRKSLAWDSAFFTSPGVLEPDELFQTTNSWFMDNRVDIFGHEGEILLPSGCLEAEVTSRVVSCDLRKSLAWDSAFFTNAGVLDPEELSMINKGFNNLETHLPGIEEDVLRSTESDFSIDSGRSSLTSLEIDLFDDIRASMNKSTNNSVSASSLKLQTGKASKKLDASSKTRAKVVPTSRKQNINPNTAERCTNKASLSAPSRKQCAAGGGELNSLSSRRPPKTLDRVGNTSVVAAKRASLGARFVKMDTAKAASGQSLTISKKPCLKNSNSVSNCSTPSPKSSLGFPAGAQKSVACSRNSSGSRFKTPLSYTRSYQAKGESSCPPYVLSTPKSSSCTSPDSSLDGWSSESSLTSAIEKSNNLRAFLSSSCRQVTFESTASQESAWLQCCRENEGQERRLLNQHNKKMPLGTCSLSSSVSKNIKPSGLRIPSPKIGYFDEENSPVSTTVGSGMSDLNEPINRLKNGKPLISRTKSGTPKQNELQSALQITPKHPTQVEDVVQNAPLNASSTRATIKISFPMTPKVESNLPHITSCEDCLGTEKLVSEGRDAAIKVIQTSSKEEHKCNGGSMEYKFGTKNKEIILKRNSKKTLEEYEEKMHFTGRDLCMDDSDKENIYRVDGLCRHVGNIDLGGDLVIELKVKKSTSDAQSAILTLKI